MCSTVEQLVLLSRTLYARDIKHDRWSYAITNAARRMMADGQQVTKKDKEDAEAILRGERLCKA